MPHEVFYNGQRRHSSLGYLSPVELERRARDAAEPARELAARRRWPAAPEFCITKPMAGGRPTLEPKGTLVAVRLADRQRHVLEQRARREGVALSEALRRCLDAWAAWSKSTSQPRPRPPPPQEPKAFDQAFAALGLTPRRSTQRRRRR